MDKSRVGERGTSVLGALVLALMLGTGAVVTFELAAPSPSPVSQAGASGVLAAAPKKAPAKLTAQKCTNVYACDQTAVANSKEVLSQPCTPGFDYTIDEKNGKINIKASPRNPGACPVAAEVPTTAELQNDKTVAKEISDAKLKLNKCSDKSLVKGHIPKGETGKCEYEYCTSLKLLATRDSKGNPAQSAGTSEEGCSNGSLDSGKTLGDVRAVARGEAIGSIVDGMTKEQLRRIDRN